MELKFSVGNFWKFLHDLGITRFFFRRVEVFKTFWPDRNKYKLFFEARKGSCV